MRLLSLHLNCLAGVRFRSEVQVAGFGLKIGGRGWGPTRGCGCPQIAEVAREPRTFCP